jgi:hypothetical protein
MLSISEQLEIDNNTGVVKLKDGINKLTLDIYYKKINKNNLNSTCPVYIEYNSDEYSLFRNYLYNITTNNKEYLRYFWQYNISDAIGTLTKYYTRLLIEYDEINKIFTFQNDHIKNIILSTCNFNINILNEIEYYNLKQSYYSVTYGERMIKHENIKYGELTKFQFFLEPLRIQLSEQTNEINNLKQLLTEQQSEIKQLKEKNKETEIEIHYLKCANPSKKITYDYNQIKKQNAKLNKEFLRIYKLIKKNIGYNLYD